MGYRVCQLRKPRNRRLVDVRSTEELPSCNRLQEVLVLKPAELIGRKVLSMTSRPNTPKGSTDLADLRRLLLTFPELKAEEGSVAEWLLAADASDEAFAAWRDLVAQDIVPEDDDMLATKGRE
jgi:hypothetical protein